MPDRQPDATGQPVAPEQVSIPAVVKKRRRRDRAFCALGVLGGIGGLIAGQLGALWIHFDVFANGTLHFIIIAVASLVGFFMPRARLLTAVVLTLAGILTISIWAHRTTTHAAILGEPAANEIPLRLMQFNTWYENNDVEAIARSIEAQDADIVTVLEFGPKKRPLLDRLKARYPYQFTCLETDYCNLVMLSKFPFAAPPTAQVDWEGPAYMRAHFGPELGNLTIIGVHTLRFPHQRAQFTQLTAMARLIESETRPLVVMGDFNATPFSRQIRTFAQRTNLTRLTNVPSWPARLQLPQLAIDHIFASAGIRLLEQERIGDNAGSDHNPISLKIAVPKT